MKILRGIFADLANKARDPLFGALVRDDGIWLGRMTWEHAEVPFALSVHRAREVPTRSDHIVFEALRTSYPAMRPLLQAAVDELWSAARKSAQALPDVGGPLDLWAKLQLQGVGLHEDGHVELIFGFADPDIAAGAFIVSVHGMQVTPQEYVE